MSLRRRPPSDGGFQPGSRAHGTRDAHIDPALHVDEPDEPDEFDESPSQETRRTGAIVRASKSDGPSHKTASIPRPASDETSVRIVAEDAARTAAMSREFTRPIAREKRLVRSPSKRLLVIGGLAVIGSALVGVLFVLPVTAWLQQQDDIDRKQLELVALEEANARLTDEVERLKTPEGIEEAAREEIGYVQRGERRLTVLPTPDAPLTLPTGWPYDQIAQIIVVKSQGDVTPDTTP